MGDYMEEEYIKEVVFEEDEKINLEEDNENENFFKQLLLGSFFLLMYNVIVKINYEEKFTYEN